MVSRTVIAVIVAVAVSLGCILLGMILGSLGMPIASTVGAFLTQWGYAIGVLCGLYQFFAGGVVWPRP